jgi:hypothetical protein
MELWINTDIFIFRRKKKRRGGAAGVGGERQGKGQYELCGRMGAAGGQSGGGGWWARFTKPFSLKKPLPTGNGLPSVNRWKPVKTDRYDQFKSI